MNGSRKPKVESGKQRAVAGERGKAMKVEKMDEGKFKEMFGPGMVDQMLRNAIQMVWVTLPKKRKKLDELEKEVRRLVDRALRDMREDEERLKR